MAIGSNIGFILYGHLAEIEPVLLLHLLLLPMNVWRLGGSFAQSPVPEARRMGPHSSRMTWESRQEPFGASCTKATQKPAGQETLPVGRYASESCQNLQPAYSSERHTDYISLIAGN
jgi:hypothetical protein